MMDLVRTPREDENSRVARSVRHARRCAETATAGANTSWATACAARSRRPIATATPLRPIYQPIECGHNGAINGPTGSSARRDRIIGGGGGGGVWARGGGGGGVV